jgi:hypothetical protein
VCYRNPRSFGLVIVSAVAAALAGCSEGRDLVDAGGKVTYKGAPVAGAMVTFQGSAVTTMAITDESGQFKLVTQGEDGVAPGKYTVTVVKSSTPAAPSTTAAGVPGQTMTDPLNAPPTDPSKMPTMEEMMNKPAVQEGTATELPAKYSQMATSGLSYDVTDDPTKNNFDIQLTDE